MAAHAHDEAGAVRGTATTNRMPMMKTFATGLVRPSGLRPAAAAASAALLAIALAACTRPASPARGPAAVPRPAVRAASFPPIEKGDTVVSITFDNNWKSQMTAAADLKAHGMAGTFYIISGWVGGSSFMSLPDLRALAADGNEIGGKTVSDADLPQLTDAEAKREICLGRDALLADGFQVTDFAYPFAKLNAEDETLVRQCGFSSGRGVGDVEDPVPGGCHYPSCAYAESIPPADPYHIITPSDGRSSTTLSSLEQTVTNAETHGGGWLVFSFHQICDTSSPGCGPVYSFPPARFNDFLTWLQGQEANGVLVRTVRQVIGGSVQPPVHAPAATASPPGSNALVNPDLRTASPADPSRPQCWTPARYGTNSAAFSWRPDGGPGGSGEETITMRDLRSGDAKLVTTFDLGQCAPTVKSGRPCRLSVSYTSSVPVFLTVYWRSGNGTWSEWTRSPSFPPSARWRRAAWLTLPVPAGIRALSFGMTIASNGTLSTTDYDLSLMPAGPASHPA
jgi:peptidoglycan/xylan/chitin deacetylase (PgdA/CDA1 family)